LNDHFYFNKYDIDGINGGLFMSDVYCLTSVLATCTLLDPMTDEERPTSQHYCCSLVYISGDRIN